MKSRHPTFARDGKKNITCNCGAFLRESRFTDDKIVNKKCQKCGIYAAIYPPRKDTKEGVKVIFFGPNEGFTTADLTGAELEE